MASNGNKQQAISNKPEGPVVVPAVLAKQMDEYNQLIEVATKISKRVSLDFMDGVFASPASINLIQAHWPQGTEVDFHLMIQKPLEQLETIISLRPSLAVVHAEAEGDLAGLIKSLQEVGIKAGVALLPGTQPQVVAELIKAADHVLIFGGHLGSYGGNFDSRQLLKIKAARAINSQAEVSWDGGVNDTNIQKVVAAGADVINSGGFILRAEDPQAAYDQLQQIAAVAAAEGDSVE